MNRSSSEAFSRRRTAGRLLVGLVPAVVSAMLWAPAAQALVNVGGGAAKATVDYATSVPVVGDPCVATSFTISGRSSPFTLTTVSPGVISGYGGALDFSGSGSSACESMTSGGGPLTIAARGSDSVDCPSLTGSYTRVGTDLLGVLSGGCTINGVASSVNFVVRGEVTPTNTGGGVSAPMTQAAFTGAVGVSPA